MKKFYLLALCCFFSTVEILAQTSSLTADELKFRDAIQQFLKEEGFIPTIDEDDNSVNFKKEGARYWITVNDSSPYYVELHKGGFNLENTKRNLMLEACNHANSTKRWGKAYLSTSVSSFTAEFYCQSIGEFRAVFYKMVRAVDSVKEDTADYYNEHDK